MGDHSLRFVCVLSTVASLTAGCGARSSIDGSGVTNGGSFSGSNNGNGQTSGRVLLFGGMQAIPTGPQFLGDTWEWDGTSWVQRMVTGPSPRAGAAFAALNGRVLVFGGGGTDDSDQAFSDTWEWDGTTWTQSAAPGPSPRSGASAATLNGRVFLFGGADSNGLVLNDTWQWDGSTWQQLSPATSPEGRSGAAMASLGGQIVMYGGGTDDEPGLGDTWAWDGQSWTLETKVDPQLGDPRYPPNVTATGVGATSAAGKLFLLAGLPSPNEPEVMWTWAAPGWVPLDVPASQSPPGRLSGQVATLGDDVILFSGWGPEETETWTWSGTAWSSSDSDPKPQPRVGAVMCELE